MVVDFSELRRNRQREISDICEYAFYNNECVCVNCYGDVKNEEDDDGRTIDRINSKNYDTLEDFISSVKLSINRIESD